MLDQETARTLLARWDAQQERYIAAREQRFDVIIEAVRLTCGETPNVIDLCCGPGSLGRRLLSRLPGACVWGVDADPMLQLIGRAACDGIRWIEADLRQPDWASFVDAGVDAVVSTTALHWLRPPQLVGVYQTLAGLLRPGGIFLNGDHCRLPAGTPSLDGLATRLTETLIARTETDADDWESWWRDMSGRPELHEAWLKREALFPKGPVERPVSAAYHVEALRTAGFAEAGTLWQLGDDWVVAAIR